MRVGVSLALGAQRVPSSGGGGGWPAVLNEGLRYRFDASEAGVIALSGSDVTAWADSGPDGWDLAHEELSWPNPTFTADEFAGGPAVVFPSGSTASDPLSRESVPGDYSGTHTLALVYEPHRIGVVHSSVVVHTGAGGAGLVYREDNDLVVVGSNESYGSPQVRAAAPASRAPMVVVATIGPSVATYKRNGTSVATMSDPGAGSSITGKLSIGNRSSISNRSPAAVGLVACWDHELTPEHEALLIAYCAARWTT